MADTNSTMAVGTMWGFRVFVAWVVALGTAMAVASAARAHSDKKNCGMCHQMPENIRLDREFEYSLEIDKLQSIPAEQLKTALIEFAKRRAAVFKYLNRESVCRGIAKYISATLRESDPCPAEVWSSTRDVKGTVDSAAEQQKEFLATILGSSTRLIQKDQKVIDSLKLIITLSFTIDLAPSILVEIYQPTFFQTSRLDGPLVDERVIPKAYSPELTAAQKSIGGYIEQAIEELRSKEGRPQ